MKILIVGSGGREHALADALSRENTSVELICAPGNPGIADIARIVDVPASDTIALAALAVRERFGERVVIKASGLAAGKGVIVCQSIAEADAAIDRVLVDHAFGDAGAECLVEEFMEGEEL